MKINRVIATLVTAPAALIFLFGWAFYQTLQLDSDRKIRLDETPRKAVMAQAQAMNQARLQALADQGRVAKDMTEEQVRLALGEPDRSEQKERDGQKLTLWFYEHYDLLRVTFDENGRVISIEGHP